MPSPPQPIEQLPRRPGSPPKSERLSLPNWPVSAIAHRERRAPPTERRRGGPTDGHGADRNRCADVGIGGVRHGRHQGGVPGPLGRTLVSLPSARARSGARPEEAPPLPRVTWPTHVRRDPNRGQAGTGGRGPDADASSCWAAPPAARSPSSRCCVVDGETVLATPDQLAGATRGRPRAGRGGRAQDPGHDLQEQDQPAPSLGPPPALLDGRDHRHLGRRRRPPPSARRAPEHRSDPVSKTKGGGSTRNGRDSNAQRLGVKTFDGTAVGGRIDPRAPARHPHPPGPQRRAGRGRHAVRARVGHGQVRLSAGAASWSTSFPTSNAASLSWSFGGHAAAGS